MLTKEPLRREFFLSRGVAFSDADAFDMDLQKHNPLDVQHKDFAGTFSSSRIRKTICKGKLTVLELAPAIIRMKLMLLMAKGVPTLRRKIYGSCGLALVGVSFPVLILMAVEVVAGSIIYGRYKIEPVINEDRSATYGGRTVRIIKNADQQAGLTYSILIDGENMPFNIVSDMGLSEDRVEMGYFTDTRNGQNQLMVAQAIGYGQEEQFRVFWISDGGTVREETFSIGSRRSPGYRLIIARWAGRHAIGYYSNVLQVWPSIFYPIAYPFGTALLGGGFVAAAIHGSRRSATPGL